MSNGSNYNWTDYIELSEKLLEKDIFPELVESAKRSAISRAYFGAFCLARNLLAEKGWLKVKNNIQDHKNVKNFFENSSDKTKKKIGTKLDRLRKRRNEADYNNVFYKVDNYAQFCVKMAKEIQEELKKIS